MSFNSLHDVYLGPEVFVFEEWGRGLLHCISLNQTNAVVQIQGWFASVS